MPDLREMKKLMDRLERLDETLTEMEGGKATRDAVAWQGRLAALTAPDMDQAMTVIEGLVSRFEKLTHGEGVARLAAKMRAKGDNRDPLEVYWRGRLHPEHGYRIEQPSGSDYSTSHKDGSASCAKAKKVRDAAAQLPRDSHSINARNAKFWAKQGVRR